MSFLVISLTVLLFVRFPQEYDSHVFKALWETGHFALFAFFVFALGHNSKIKSYKFWQLFIATAIFCLSVGLLTEIIQFYIGRSFDIKDIINDLLGGYTGLFLTRINKNNALPKNLAFCVSFLILVFIGSHELLTTSFTQWQIENKFPIISDFEEPLELTQWTNIRTNISLSKKYKRHGNYSMKVDYKVKKSPRVYLQHFIHDWSDYRNLKLSIYNESQKPLNIVLKIYDEKHRDSGYIASDRFNLKTAIQPGWNDLNLSLSDIKQAPDDRLMNMKKITSLGVWVHGLKKPISLYIDNIHLINK